MMKKILFVLLISSTLHLSAKSQDITTYFLDMPVYLLPASNNSLRLEMLENFTKNGKDSIENLLGGKARILALDTVNQYISINPAKNGRFEMKIFERSDKSKVIGIINTVCAPACSSYIRFYDESWKEIDLNFPKLTNDNWVKSTELIIDGAKIKDILRVSFIELHFDPKSGNIEAQNNSLDFLSLDEKKRMEPHVEKKAIPIKWNNGSFIL